MGFNTTQEPHIPDAINSSVKFCPVHQCCWEYTDPRIDEWDFLPKSPRLGKPEVKCPDCISGFTKINIYL